MFMSIIITTITITVTVVTTTNTLHFLEFITSSTVQYPLRCEPQSDYDTDEGREFVETILGLGITD